MMSKEAMKLALEALEYIYEGANNQGPHTGISWRCVSNKAAPAITALRQALANEALDKKAENARELELDYEMPITMQEGEFDCTHAERLCAELKTAHPVTPCTHPSLGACALREDGAASRWNCVMCGTEFVPKATNRWAEFNEATKRNMEHSEWYLSTHPQPAQQEPVAWRYLTKYKDQSVWTYCAFEPTSRETWEALYTSPPAQRTWVGLTDEEKRQLFEREDYQGWLDYINAIEAKLKERNA